ncbi:MAG: signal peptide peptidase SppA [Verrucomicrobia bacterium]|nr:signal peptide peptidase SppA [Verrucomicrobiota bacterium]
MNEKKKSGRGCLWALVAFLSLLVIAGGFILLASLFIGKHTSITTPVARHGADEFPDLSEVWAYGKGKTKVISIPLRGFIHLDPGNDMFGPVTTATQMALLGIRRATRDDDVKAIIMEIDSGGGGITASDIVYKALMDFRDAQPGRKIVVVFGDVSASGAYYISLAADQIMARPTSITGSIGVLMQSLNMRLLGEKIGVTDVTIKSGANKDIMNPLREMSAEQRAMLQAVVDDLHSRFVGLVVERRNLPEAEVRALADGRIFTAQDAVASGLIDGIGYWDDAVNATADLLGVPRIKIYRYEEEFSLSSFLRSSQRLNPTARLLDSLSSARFLYQWQL